MANGEGNRRPHFVLQNVASPHKFSSPKSGRDETVVPPRERAAHAASLREQLAVVAEEATENVGLQIEFRSFEGIELATSSLARDRSGIELLNVRIQGEVTYATVFVPEGKLGHFEKLITEYATHRRDRNERPLDHQKLIDAIREIRAATVRALWTDEEVFPVDATDPIAWEVWLPVRRDRGQVLANFRDLARAVGWRVSEHAIEFPERTVVVAVGTQQQLEHSAQLLGLIAELRRAKETAAFFDELEGVRNFVFEAYHDLQESLCRSNERTPRRRLPLS